MQLLVYAKVINTSDCYKYRNDKLVRIIYVSIYVFNYVFKSYNNKKPQLMICSYLQCPQDPYVPKYPRSMGTLDPQVHWIPRYPRSLCTLDPQVPRIPGTLNPYVEEVPPKMYCISRVGINIFMNLTSKASVSKNVVWAKIIILTFLLTPALEKI